MKTSDSIEEQSERKAAKGDGKEAPASPASTQSGKRKGPHGDFSRIKAWAWKPGQSGNPKGGSARHDLASEIARAVFQQNAEALYLAYSKAALRGNAYAFKELADRAYGKIKERIELEVPYRDMTEAELLERMHQLERQLGITVPIDQTSEPKPN